MSAFSGQKREKLKWGKKTQGVIQKWALAWICSLLFSTRVNLKTFFSFKEQRTILNTKEMQFSMMSSENRKYRNDGEKYDEIHSCTYTRAYNVTTCTTVLNACQQYSDVKMLKAFCHKFQ